MGRGDFYLLEAQAGLGGEGQEIDFRCSFSPGYLAASQTHLSTTLQQDSLLPSSSLGSPHHCILLPHHQNPTGTHKSLENHPENTKHQGGAGELRG